MKFIIALLLTVILVVFSCRENRQNEHALAGGELEYRLDRIIDRITEGELPRITKDFLLAGLTLDPAFERRFTNYSGDQEGRYLSAMSLVDDKRHSIDIHELVNAFITEQKADGRFGADTLDFDAGSIEGPQMALLWGNGRMLTGLMDYYEKNPDSTHALEAAKKLADFLDGVTYACTQPEIIDRFKTMGALGFICFTQITEGMVKLYEVTGTDRYRSIAETIYPLLPEFGNQHSHGFLNTLRGVVMLYEATMNPVHLQYAEDIFEELVASDNYLISGGLPEFFSLDQSHEEVRDEGCTEADFFILCLQLWKATGNHHYLDKAEYLFMNHMLYNQFRSGDFGHHVIKRDFGFVTSPVPGQSWWCCNYHGLHALHDAREAVVTREGHLRMVNLFYPANYNDEGMAFTITKIPGATLSYELNINSVADMEARLAIRDPHWSRETRVTINGREVQSNPESRYIIVDASLMKGDKISYDLNPGMRILDYNRDEIPITRLGSDPVTGALIYGPWLMSTDDIYQNLFMTELSHYNNIYIPADGLSVMADQALIPGSTFNPESYLTFTFLKEGTSQKASVIMRPISEVSFQGPSNVRHWFNFAVDK